MENKPQQTEDTTTTPEATKSNTEPKEDDKQKTEEPEDPSFKSPPNDTEEYDRQQELSKAAQSTNRYQFMKKPSTRSGAQSSTNKSQSDTSIQKEGSTSEKTHFEVRWNYNLETHCSKIDESFVDYLMDIARGNFIIYFDQSLYEPPKIILDLE